MSWSLGFSVETVGFRKVACSVGRASWRRPTAGKATGDMGGCLDTVGWATQGREDVEGSGVLGVGFLRLRLASVGQTCSDFLDRFGQGSSCLTAFGHDCVTHQVKAAGLVSKLVGGQGSPDPNLRSPDDASLEFEATLPRPWQPGAKWCRIAESGLGRLDFGLSKSGAHGRQSVHCVQGRSSALWGSAAVGHAGFFAVGRSWLRKAGRAGRQVSWCPRFLPGSVWLFSPSFFLESEEARFRVTP